MYVHLRIISLWLSGINELKCISSSSIEWAIHDAINDTVYYIASSRKCNLNNFCVCCCWLVFKTNTFGVSFHHYAITPLLLLSIIILLKCMQFDAHIAKMTRKVLGDGVAISNSARTHPNTPHYSKSICFLRSFALLLLSH